MCMHKKFFLQKVSDRKKDIFTPLAWKGLSRASSSQIVRRSVFPIFCPAYKVQYLKFGWSYSYQTWNVCSSKGCSYFTDITDP